METSLSKLETAVARMEGIVTTEIKHLGHDVKSLSMKMDAQAQIFVPRREIEANDKALSDRIDELHSRVGWTDRRLWAAAAAALGALLTVLLNSFGFHFGAGH